MYPFSSVRLRIRDRLRPRHFAFVIVISFLVVGLVIVVDVSFVLVCSRVHRLSSPSSAFVFIVAVIVFADIVVVIVSLNTVAVIVFAGRRLRSPSLLFVSPLFVGALVVIAVLVAELPPT